MLWGPERRSNVLISWLLSLVSPFTVRKEADPSPDRFRPGIWRTPAFHPQGKLRVEFQ
jgi:hypothetical protein